MKNVALVCWVSLTLPQLACSSDSTKRIHPDASPDVDGGYQPDASGDVPLRLDQAPDNADASSSDVMIVLRDRYVTPTGVDTLPCRQEAPCKNLAFAATGLERGSTLYVGDGNYDNTNQMPANFSLPDETALQAINANAAVLKNLAITATGSATLKGLTLDGTTQLTAGAATGLPVITLNGIKLRSKADSLGGFGMLNFKGTVKASLTAPADGIFTLPGSACGYLASLRESAELHIGPGSIDCHNVQVVTASVFSIRDASQLTLDGTAVVNVNGTGGSTEAAVIVTSGSNADAKAHVTLQGGASITNVRNLGNSSIALRGITLGNFAVLLLDHATLSGFDTTALAGSGGGSGISNVSITLRNGTQLTNNSQHAVWTFNGQGSELVTFDGVTMTGATGTAYVLAILGSAATVVDINKLTYSNNYPSVTSNVSLATVRVGNFKMRNSVVTGNGGIGLALLTPGSGTPVVDFGTSVSAGSNTFSGNVSTNLDLSTLGALNISAAGNTWEKDVQGADGSGTYAAGPFGGTRLGKNFNLSANMILTL